MSNYQSPIQRFLDSMAKTADVALRLQFQRDMIKQNLLDQQEWETLADDVANRVLSRISATVDATEVFQQIDEVKHALDELYKYFQ